MFHSGTTKNHVCHRLCVQSHDDVVILNVISNQFSPIWHIMKIPAFLYRYINLYLVNIYWLLFRSAIRSPPLSVFCLSEPLVCFFLSTSRTVRCWIEIRLATVGKSQTWTSYFIFHEGLGKYNFSERFVFTVHESKSRQANSLLFSSLIWVEAGKALFNVTWHPPTLEIT